MFFFFPPAEMLVFEDMPTCGKNLVFSHFCASKMTSI